MQSEEFVQVSVEHAVATITLQRGAVNAVDLATYDQLRRTFHRLGEEPGLRCAILTGAGKIFCGGNDVNDFVDLDAEGSTEYLAHVRLAFNALYDCPIPVIAAVQGSAVGTGLVLASLCDVRIVSETAKFALPEIDVGVLGASKHTMRLATQGYTRLMMLSGRRITAAEALRVGLADIVVPGPSVMDEARKLAAEIADKSPPAIRLAKEGLNRIESMNLKEAYEYECTLTTRVRRTPEAKEAALAFVEKRRPSYALVR